REETAHSGEDPRAILDERRYRVLHPLALPLLLIDQVRVALPGRNHREDVLLPRDAVVDYDRLVANALRGLEAFPELLEVIDPHPRAAICFREFDEVGILAQIDR